MCSSSKLILPTHTAVGRRRGMFPDPRSWVPGGNQKRRSNEKPQKAEMGWGVEKDRGEE